ncbi:MAG: DUF2064 domain-containing protein [Gammaproteobacteria bacterium]|nr:DUF2064 domain-containing protein [Gammaproteobacteria bacterium]MYF59093.1 DUF2064 domain-containing protein [Gammaproteobacteria bacterium]
MSLFRLNSSIAQRRDCALALVFRRPRERHGKRRLAASLEERAVVELCRLMLDCALEDLRGWRGPVVLVPEDRDDLDWARSLPARRPDRPAPVTVLAQGAGNLGRRLERLDRALDAMQLTRRIYIGSDAPALKPRHYRRVIAGLATHDAVLAAARDGGVTMMATRRGWPQLARLPWGTPGLAHALSAACRRTGRPALEIPGGFDVDRRSDLATLARALRGDARPARRELHRWIARNRLA